MQLPQQPGAQDFCTPVRESTYRTLHSMQGLSFKACKAIFRTHVSTDFPARSVKYGTVPNYVQEYLENVRTT